MANAQRGKFSESQAEFFIEEVCDLGDHVYRFAYALTLDPADAIKMVEHSFEVASNNITQLMKLTPEAMRVYLLNECWRQHRPKPAQTQGKVSDLVSLIRMMEPNVRAAVAAVDICGCTVDEAKSFLKFDDQQMRSFLAAGRRLYAQNIDKASPPPEPEEDASNFKGWTEEDDDALQQ